MLRLPPSQNYWVAVAASLVVAYLGWRAPTYRMPLDYDAIAFRSIPFAIVWTMIVALGVWRYGMRGLWLLAGAPMALYWPVWFLFNRFPPCYYLLNCA